MVVNNKNRPQYNYNMAKPITGKDISCLQYKFNCFPFLENRYTDPFTVSETYFYILDSRNSDSVLPDAGLVRWFICSRE